VRELLVAAPVVVTQKTQKTQVAQMAKVTQMAQTTQVPQVAQVPQGRLNLVWDQTALKIINLKTLVVPEGEREVRCGIKFVMTTASMSVLGNVCAD